MSISYAVFCLKKKKTKTYITTIQHKYICNHQLSACLYRSTTIRPYFLFTAPATPEIYTLSLHDALPIYAAPDRAGAPRGDAARASSRRRARRRRAEREALSFDRERNGEQIGRADV